MTLFDITLPASLAIPVAFLLQEYSNEELSSYQDHNSFSFYHWAITNNDLPKIQELLNHNIDFSICTLNNLVPPNVFITHNLCNNNDYYNIPFTKGGYSAIHLCVLLHSLHRNIALDDFNNSTKGGFKNSSIKEIQLKIFNNLLEKNPNIFEIEDTIGYSVLDYCFLYENIELISLYVENDSSFNALNYVKTQTALNIINNLKFKYAILNKNGGNALAPDGKIIEFLTKKINYESLNNKIENKTVLNAIKKRKI